MEDDLESDHELLEEEEQDLVLSKEKLNLEVGLKFACPVDFRNATRLKKYYQ